MDRPKTLRDNFELEVVFKISCFGLLEFREKNRLVTIQTHPRVLGYEADRFRVIF